MGLNPYKKTIITSALAGLLKVYGPAGTVLMYFIYLNLSDVGFDASYLMFYWALSVFIIVSHLLLRLYFVSQYNNVLHDKLH